MREQEDHNLNTCGYIFVSLKRAWLKCVWEDPKGFFVRNRVGKAILDLAILLATKDVTWMAGQWFVLSSRFLGSSFPFQPGHRRWPYANTDPNCLILVNGLKAKSIFQAFSLSQGIMWEELRLRKCICTLKKVFV